MASRRRNLTFDEWAELGLLVNRMYEDWIRAGALIRRAFPNAATASRESEKMDAALGRLKAELDGASSMQLPSSQWSTRLFYGGVEKHEEYVASVRDGSYPGWR